jgi:hypothetical protein
MVSAGLIVEFVFDGLGLIPGERNAKVVEASVTWNYTTVLNIIFLAQAGSLLWRYFRRGGGPRMLKPLAHSTVPLGRHVRGGELPVPTGVPLPTKGARAGQSTNQTGRDAEGDSSFRGAEKRRRPPSRR